MGLGTNPPSALFLNCQYSQGDSMCDSLGDSFLPHPWADFGLRRSRLHAVKFFFFFLTFHQYAQPTKKRNPTEPNGEHTPLVV